MSTLQSDPQQSQRPATQGPYRIVLTGGPCAGKTSALRHLVGHLSGRGWQVLVIPEAATMLIGGGLHALGDMAAQDRRRWLEVQENLVLLQDDLHRRFTSLADAVGAEKTVLIFDRAELDNRAYMSRPEFEQVLAASLEETPGAVAARYDAVVHMVTAAAGSTDAYTTENNEARSETPAEAVALDEAVMQAWLGHPHLTVIRNEGSFEQKLTRVLAAVLNALGEPEPVEAERKWLLTAPPPADLVAGSVPVDIEQIYLASVGGSERRIRARTYDGHTSYFLTVKRPAGAGLDLRKRIEHEVVIDRARYVDLAASRLPGTAVIRKQRYCFVYEGQHFELDRFADPVQTWLLEAELVTAEDEVVLPPSLAVGREVTDDPAWRNAAIAARGGQSVRAAG